MDNSFRKLVESGEIAVSSMATLMSCLLFKELVGTEFLSVK